MEAAISECERENVDGEARDLWTGQLVSFVWDVGGGEEKKGPHFAGITFGNRETLKKSAFVSIQQIIYSICDGPGDV